jgi:hypothetical protein
VDSGNDARAPLLFIADGADHLMPPSVNRSNAKHYAKYKAVIDYKEFPRRSHYTCASRVRGSRRLRPCVGDDERNPPGGLSAAGARSAALKMGPCGGVEPVRLHGPPAGTVDAGTAAPGRMCVWRGLRR